MRLRAFSFCRVLLCVVVFAAAVTLAPSSAWCAELGGVEAQGGTSSQEAAEQAETDNHAVTNTQTEADNQAGAESQAVANNQAEADSQADADSGRYIKVLGVDAENLHLEVDGKTLDIPLPDGYEPMVPEEYPNTYAWFINVAKKAETLPLCALVYSEDNERGKVDPSFQVNRTAFLEIERDYIPHRFSVEGFHNEIDNIKYIDNELWDWCNLQFTQNQKPAFTNTYIYEDLTAIASLRIENAPSDKRNYRSGSSVIEILMRDIAIYIRFYEDIYADSNIQSLKDTSLTYIHKLKIR